VGHGFLTRYPACLEYDWKQWCLMLVVVVEAAQSVVAVVVAKGVG